MSGFRHTFCQSCEANENDGDDICQLCNDLCVNCCLYAGEHPIRNCSDKTCNMCSPHCEWCVYMNHTVKTHPGKTYNGELPMKCDHIGKTRLEQNQEKVLCYKKNIEDTKKRLRDQEKALDDLQKELGKTDGKNNVGENNDNDIKKIKRKTTCKSCGNEGHNSRTCKNKV